MSNLITTIIGIALIAIATLMGLFFGGIAYDQASISAYAAETISVMQQIKEAVYIYQSYNPGQTNTTTITSGITAANNSYLNLPYYSNYSSWNINYGTHGNLIDWISGPGAPAGDSTHFWSARLQLQSDSTGNIWVVWNLDMGPSSASDRSFYAQVCYAINQQMNQIPYPVGITTSTWYSQLLPYNNGGYQPAGGSNYYPNLCMVSGNPYMTFAIQI